MLEIWRTSGRNLRPHERVRIGMSGRRPSRTGTAMTHGVQIACLLLVASVLTAVPGLAAEPVAASTPLVIGETFTIESKVLAEKRVINVYLPPGYAASGDQRYPVLYMPDGGIAEDFLHVAGLVQVSVGNGTMRPFVLVGIENTERRRDLTGPTEVERDREIAPRVGGSKAFRQFIRKELMPAIGKRYRTTGEKAIVGESLAGLFVVETLLLEPDLFDTYIAFDPSLWWNDRDLVRSAERLLRKLGEQPRTLYLAASSQPQIAEATRALADVLASGVAPSLEWHHETMPDEHHHTIYHPAALAAFREVFTPPVPEGSE